ncbi:hypothetical protein [Orrella marina]|uniref:Uncharacterized protein n=1 Tax=Orrella marina TaxID=2163011 RepID=A0A2R4XHK5_9BURK|nr:hypothetical protein [Orrella marina]AWB33275.1 hypothetical protein DBV39_05655 [Orrella marina]
MNTPAPSSNTTASNGLTTPNSWGRFAGIMAIFVLLGPIAGALGVNILFALMATGQEIATQGFNLSEILRLLVGGVVIGTIVSAIMAYSFGIFSAVGVGLTVALGDRRNLGVSWKLGLIAALLFWILLSGVASTFVPEQGLRAWVGALLIGHVLAALVCIGLARRIFGKA